MLPLPCSLDTGRLNPETYRLFDKVEKHYNIRIEYTFPDAEKVQDLVRTKGLFSFYEDGHTECCRIRKVGCIPGYPCLFREAYLSPQQQAGSVSHQARQGA